MENRIELIEEKLESITEHIKNVDFQIEKLKTVNMLDEIIVLENGKKQRMTIKEILIDNYKLLEPIRFIYDTIFFFNKHKILRFFFIIINVLIISALLGFSLTGQGLLEIMGLIK